MRSALMTIVRQRSSVVLASAGLTAAVAASAVAFALPSDAATPAPSGTPHAAAATSDEQHGQATLAFSTKDLPTGVTPVVAAGDTGKLVNAPYLQQHGAQHSDTLTTAPYQAPAKPQPAAPAAAPQAAQEQAPAPQPAAPAQPAPQPAPQSAPAPAPQPAPAPAPQPAPAPAPQPAPQPAPAVATDTSPSGLQRLAQSMVPADQWASFNQIVSHESSWNPLAVNPSSGSYGLGQALPAGKMASAGADWRTNPVTQIKWTLNYMNERYGSPNAAWTWWQAHHWY